MEKNEKTPPDYNSSYAPPYQTSYYPQAPNAPNTTNVEQRYVIPPSHVSITTIQSGQPPSVGFIPPPTPNNNYNPQYPPQSVPPTTGWFDRNQKNKPQSNSTGAACLVLASGGMNWAWSAGFIFTTSFVVTTHMRICWFIGAIIGALLSSVLTRRVPTKLLYIASSLLVTIGGILLVSLSDDPDAIVAAHYLDGIGVGLIIVPMLVVIGEETVKEMRGTNASLLVTHSFAIGFMLGIVYTATYAGIGYAEYSWDAIQMQGVLSIFYGALSVLMSVYLVVESPVYYLLRNDETMALDCLRRLQRPFVVTFETYEQFEELKRYVADNARMGGLGLMGLLKLCFYQGVASMNFTPLMTGALMTSSFIYYGLDSYWTFIVYGVMRWVGAFITGFTMDSGGRRNPILVGALVFGALSIGVGSILDDMYNVLNMEKMGATLWMLIIMQLFAGVFVCSAPVYNTEAHPLAYKQYYIACGFIIEMLVQIIIGAVTLTFSSYAPYFITMGALYIFFFIISIFGMPETKKDTLRVAQGKFRKVQAIGTNWN